MLKISDSGEGSWREREETGGGGNGRMRRGRGEEREREKERGRGERLLVRRQWSMVARGYPAAMVGINTGCRRHLRR